MRSTALRIAAGRHASPPPRRRSRSASALAAAVVADARPRCERQQESCAALRRHRMPLFRVEAEQITGDRALGVVPRVDPRLARDDEQESRLLDLVVAELLPRLECDENDTALAVLRV